MREIGFAVVAMTLTLAAVYAPVAFTPGSTGRLFLEFALTLAGAVRDLGLRRADADADDVLEAPQARRAAECHLRALIEALLDGLERGYRALARSRSALRYLAVRCCALVVAGIGVCCSSRS